MKPQKKSWLFIALVAITMLLAQFALAKVFIDKAKVLYGIEVNTNDAATLVVSAVLVIGVVRYANRRERRLMARTNCAYAGTFQDVWVSWIMERFYQDFPFLRHMRDLSEYVKNDIINVRAIGADPEVFINNNTYPLPTRERNDLNYPIQLDKYETANTAITLKEIDRLNYSKFMTATKQHQAVLMEKAQAKWTHALGALADSLTTPVLECTGADRGDGTKKAKFEDFVRWQAKLDNIGMPMSGRACVMSSNHRADIVAEDAGRFKYLSDLQTGECADFAGLKVYASIFTPKYHKGTGVKKAFGAVSDSNDCDASIVWHEGEVGYAKGSMTMFHKPLNINTETRREEVGFTMYGIGLPISGKFISALYSKQA